MYQTMSYDKQMKMKEAQVKEILDAAIVGDYEFEGVKASPKEFAYRNKMEFSFGDEYKDGPLSLGLHKKGSTYDVLTAELKNIRMIALFLLISCFSTFSSAILDSSTFFFISSVSSNSFCVERKSYSGRTLSAFSPKETRKSLLISSFFLPYFFLSGR